MKLRVNGVNREVSATTLAELLDEMSFGKLVATAVNREVILRGQRATWQLSPNDEIEILAPMGGG